MSEFQHEQQKSHTEVYANSSEIEILREWRWVNKLPGYGGEYSQRIHEMAQDYQQAVNLEIEAWRIRNGQEKGADCTHEVTPQDLEQAQGLRAQAHNLRLESVNKSAELAKAIKSRWSEQQITMARAADKSIKRGEPYSRDLNRDIRR